MFILTFFYFFTNIYKKYIFDIMAKLLKIGAEYVPNYVVTLSDGTKQQEPCIMFYFDSDEGNELFYSIKRKQLTLLYLFNIICTIVECILESCHEFLNANQEQKQLMINFYFLVSLFHNIIIFFSFYFIIREQFKSINLNVLYNDSEDPDGDGLIDDDFIEEQVKNMQEEKKLTEQTKKREDRDGRISYSTEDFEYLNNNTKNSSILV